MQIADCRLTTGHLASFSICILHSAICNPALECRARYNLHMTAFDDHRDELERYEFMMGVPRGRLAVTLDLITDALAFVGQHGVYCQSARQVGKPAMDIQIIMKNMNDAKALIQSVMAELEKAQSEK